LADGAESRIAQDPAGAVSSQGIAVEGRFVSTVARNSALVMGTQVGMKALAFLFNVYVVRRLGAEHFGQYAAVIAFVGIFGIFSDLGMAPYMLREQCGEPLCALANFQSVCYLTLTIAPYNDVDVQRLVRVYLCGSPRWQ